MVNQTKIQKAQEMLDNGADIHEIAKDPTVDRGERTIYDWLNKGWIRRKITSKKLAQKHVQLLPGFPPFDESPYWIRDFLSFLEKYFDDVLYTKPWITRDLQAFVPGMDDATAVYLTKVWDDSRHAKFGEDGENPEVATTTYVVCELYAAYVAPDAPSTIRELLALSWETVIDTREFEKPAWSITPNRRDLVYYTDLLTRFSPWKSNYHRVIWEEKLQEYFPRNNPAKDKGSTKLRAWHELIVYELPVDQQQAVKDFRERMDEKNVGFFDPIGDQLLEGGE